MIRCYHYQTYYQGFLSECSLHVLDYYFSNVRHLIFEVNWLLDISLPDFDYLDHLYYKAFPVRDVVNFYDQMDRLVDYLNTHGYSDFVLALLDLLQRVRYLLPVPDPVL